MPPPISPTTDVGMPQFEGSAGLDVYCRHRRGKLLAPAERAWLESLTPNQLDQLDVLYLMRRDAERLARRVLMAGGTVVTERIFGGERSFEVRSGKADAGRRRYAGRRRESHGLRRGHRRPRAKSSRSSAASGDSGDSEPAPPAVRVRRGRIGCVA
jgi:hypothetical protein